MFEDTKTRKDRLGKQKSQMEIHKEIDNFIDNFFEGGVVEYMEKEAKRESLYRWAMFLLGVVCGFAVESLIVSIIFNI